MAIDQTRDAGQLEQAVQEIRTQLVGKTSKRYLEQIEEAVQQLQENPKRQPKDMLSSSAPILDNFYEHGYLLFQAGKYNDAIKIFNWLKSIDVTDMRYPFGIAASWHHLKKYPEAASNYLVSIVVNPFDPLTYFHLYDCLMQMQSPTAAIVALELATIFAADQPKYAQFRERCMLELTQLEQTLTKK